MHKNVLQKRVNFLKLFLSDSILINNIQVFIEKVITFKIKFQYLQKLSKLCFDLKQFYSRRKNRLRFFVLQLSVMKLFYIKYIRSYIIFRFKFTFLNIKVRNSKLSKFKQFCNFIISKLSICLCQVTARQTSCKSFLFYIKVYLLV